MPKGDGTGPTGQEPGTGKGLNRGAGRGQMVGIGGRTRRILCMHVMWR